VNSWALCPYLSFGPLFYTLPGSRTSLHSIETTCLHIVLFSRARAQREQKQKNPRRFQAQNRRPSDAILPHGQVSAFQTTPPRTAAAARAARTRAPVDAQCRPHSRSVLRHGAAPGSTRGSDVGDLGAATTAPTRKSRGSRKKRCGRR